MSSTTGTSTDAQTAAPGGGGPINRALLAALASPATYRGRPPVTVCETHASWVFLAGAEAYKVKKPLDLGFLDYSTLARRHAACREEVRVNRELAGGLYLGVKAIVAAAGSFRLTGEDAEDAVEYAVHMRRFCQQDTLAGVIDAGALGSRHLAAVATRLARFHRRASPVCSWRPEQVLAAWQANLAGLADSGAPARWRLQLAGGFAEAFVDAHALEIKRRALQGFVRDGHGDLRCEHVLLARDAVQLIDRIEFDGALRRIDVAADLAFLAMDLEARGEGWAAGELFRYYRQAGVSPGSAQLRAFYAAHWALVRAKVALLAAAELHGQARREQLELAERHWRLGEQLCWRARKPLAIVVCGPAASGKSTLAAELARRSGMSVISSDVVRKAAAGLAPEQRASPEHYRARLNRATYELVGRQAQQALRREDGVIVDATCRSRVDRALLLGPLQRIGLTLLIVRCELPLALACERARRRAADTDRVSDATPEVVAEHYRSFEPLDELPPTSVLRLSTAAPLADQLATVTDAVDRLLAPSHGAAAQDRAQAPERR